MNQINPVKPGDTSLGVVLSALSAGFAFISLAAELEATVASIAGQAETAPTYSWARKGVASYGIIGLRVQTACRLRICHGECARAITN